MSDLRVLITVPYQPNMRFIGNGISKFCMKCNVHRPYSTGGAYVGPKGMKYWICHLHITPTREK